MKIVSSHPSPASPRGSSWPPRLVILMLAAILMAPWASVFGQGNVPDRMSYQGYLIDNNGAPFATNGPANYKVRFKIYDPANAALWAEEQVVTIDKGYFSVMLGEGSAVPGFTDKHQLVPVFQGSTASERYLGVEVDGANNGTFTPILPRARLLPSPYAFLAQNAKQAESVSGGGITGKIALGNLPDSLTSAAWSESGGNVFRVTGNVGIGTATPTSKLHVNGQVNISTNHLLQLGVGIPGRTAAAGGIGYKKYSSGLDIVGANQTDNLDDRKIVMWAEAGTDFAGPVNAPAVTANNMTVTSALNFGGSAKPFVTKTWTKRPGNVPKDTSKPVNEWDAVLAGFSARGDINERELKSMGVRLVKGGPGEELGTSLAPNANWYIVPSFPDENSGSLFTVTVLFIRKGWVSEEAAEE